MIIKLLHGHYKLPEKQWKKEQNKILLNQPNKKYTVNLFMLIYIYTFHDKLRVVHFMYSIMYVEQFLKFKFIFESLIFSRCNICLLKACEVLLTIWLWQYLFKGVFVLYL